MLRLWIGRAKSGKSRQVLQEMRETGMAREQILLVPEHASHQAERDLCAVCGRQANLYAEVLSFSRLSTRVLSLTGGLADYTLDQGGKLLTMHAALQETAARLKLYRRPSQRVAFLKELVSLMDEFHAYDVTPQRLLDSAEKLPAGPEQDKLRDLGLLYTAYEGRLRHDVEDSRDRISKLADRVEESGYFQKKDVYVDGFSLFNLQERRILRTALRQAERVTVVLLGERGDQSEIFAQSRSCGESLLRMAQEEGVGSEIRYFRTEEPTAELPFLEKYFFSPERTYEQDSGAITLYQAQTAFTEAEWAASEILRLVRSRQCRFRDITVAARHLADYEATLENVFARYGIPLFLNRRSDILEKPALTLLTAALETVANGCEYEDLFRYLKTGLAGLTPEECDQLENYAIVWDLRGQVWLREAPFTANPDGYGAPMGPRQQEQLALLNQLRQRVRGPLVFLAEGLRREAGAAGKTRVLYEFLELLQLPRALEEKCSALQQAGQEQLAEEYAQIWQILCGVMDQFVAIEGERELSVDAFSSLFRLVLTQYSVGSIPVSLDQVNVSEITRNDRHTVRYLFLLGANDHVLPDVSKPTGILTEEERRLLQQQNLELAPSGMARFQLELQNLYAALAQPAEGLFISYPLTDVSGTQLRPSFVIDRVLTLFPQLKLCREASDKEFRLTARQPALEMLSEAEDEGLRRYFAGQPQYAVQLQRMEQAARRQRGKLSPQAVRALYGEQLAMSASRMDQIASCHFSYFMQYGLKARERKKADFAAPEIGTFLHFILEQVAREAQRAGGFAAVSQTQLHRWTEQAVRQYVQQELPDYEEKSKRFRYLFQRLQKSVYAVVEDVAAELAKSDFQPLAFELSFGDGGQLPAVALTEGETRLRVSGKVDRVDGWCKDDKLYIRVVDYKTGKKNFALSDLRYGLNLQMLLYLFALEKEGRACFGREAVPAGVLYLPARDALLPASRRLTPEEREKERSKTLQRSGLVLDEGAVLQAMEHGALEKPQYLPLELKKDGSVKKGAASAADFACLQRYVDRVLRGIAREMAAGNISADPLARDETDNACQYCAFRAACHFEEGCGGDRFTYRRKTAPEAFWAELREEEQTWEKNN